jgi:hypothetical protein
MREGVGREKRIIEDHGHGLSQMDANLQTTPELG